MAKLKKGQEVRVYIRDYSPERDLWRISQIEWENFEFPWLPREFVDFLKRRNCWCLVAVLDARILGYIVYSWRKNRIKIFNLGVAEDSWCHGVGTQLVAKLIGMLASSGRKTIITKIRETNLSALMFFKSCGFQAVRVMHRQYDNTADDAYIMRYLCGQCERKDRNKRPR